MVSVWSESCRSVTSRKPPWASEQQNQTRTVNSTGAGALIGAYSKQKPTARGPPGKPGPYMGWMFLYRRFSPQPALRATESQEGRLGEVHPANRRKVIRQVIRANRHVRTCVEVQLMYARFTESAIDPKKREQAETIA